MRCCHCNRRIMQTEIDNGTVNELMGIVSHVACDNEQLARQEKLVKYTNKKLIDTGSI